MAMARQLFVTFCSVNFLLAMFALTGKIAQGVNPGLYEGFWGDAIASVVVGFLGSWVFTVGAAIAWALASAGRRSSGMPTPTAARRVHWVFWLWFGFASLMLLRFLFGLIRFVFL